MRNICFLETILHSDALPHTPATSSLIQCCCTHSLLNNLAKILNVASTKVNMKTNYIYNKKKSHYL